MSGIKQIASTYARATWAQTSCCTVYDDCTVYSLLSVNSKRRYTFDECGRRGVSTALVQGNIK